jgi:hypothetical protein
MKNLGSTGDAPSRAAARQRKPPAPAAPLTHHEILTLVEPFTRRGRHPDLAASDRLARKLVFRPVERPGATPDSPVVSDTLELQSRDAETFRLTRTLRTAGLAADLAAGLDGRRDGRLEARLEAEGGDPGELLECIEAVPPESQFLFVCGYGAARSYRLLRGDESRGAASGAGRAPAQKILTRWSAEFDGLSVAFTAPVRKGDPEGDLELRPADGNALQLPEDLLAVLGWDWELLDRKKQGFRSSLRLRGQEPGRSRNAERNLELMAGHLARTLAEAPARFHQRLAGARWGVALRRAIPVLIFLGLLAGALATARLNIPANSGLWMVLFNAPPLLFLLVFCMRKLPRIEIPPVPRCSKAPDWRTPAPARRARKATPAQPLQPG